MPSKNLEELAKQASLEQLPAYSDLYAEGKEWIEQTIGIRLTPDATCNTTALHRISKLAIPSKMQGLNIPADFRYYRPITPEEFDEAQTIWRNDGIQELPKDVADFWSPFFMPKSANSTSMLELYVAQHLQLKAMYEAQFGGAVHHQGISFAPNECIAATEWPSAWIPEREWFDPALEQVEIKDILTLFAEPEQEMLALCFGRAVVGRADSLPVARKRQVRHTFRTMPVIFGAEPGQGKSVFANMLIQAMKSVGYRVSNFKSLNQRFNLGDVVTAHVA